jgi:hypothetical protein
MFLKHQNFIIFIWSYHIQSLYLVNCSCPFLSSITPNDIYLPSYKWENANCISHQKARETLFDMYLVDSTVLNTIHNFGSIMTTSRSSKHSSTTLMNIINCFWCQAHSITSIKSSVATLCIDPKTVINTDHTSIILQPGNLWYYSNNKVLCLMCYSLIHFVCSLSIIVIIINTTTIITNMISPLIFTDIDSSFCWGSTKEYSAHEQIHR